ncbi:T7SS effector LXG polymorphic toxin, partial [Shouchella clausii]
EGGEAIKDHFATLHLPVLAAFQLFIGQYIEQLKQIRSNLLNFESSSALIREEFLADVKNGLDRVERYAIEDATAIESIRASIADLLPLPPFSMEPVLRYAQQGKDHVRVTAERLGNLDEANEAVLSSAKSTLQELTTVVSQVADWSSGGVIPSPETQAEIDANMEKLYQNVVTQALQMAPLDRSHVEGREGDLYQDVLPLEFLYTGAYAPLYSGLKAANWYYLNHFPVSAILSNEQALQACRAPAMGATQAVSPSYFPLFARLSTLPVEATVSPDVLTQQLQQLVPIQYQWYQAQLRNQAIHTDTSQVVAIPEYMFTDQEVAAINTYLENHPPNEERLNTNPIVTGVVDFLFGDYITLVDPEASLGEKALATTFILVKPAKVGGVIYDLSKARKVKTGNRTSQVNKVNIPENSIKHSNIGDFTTNPRTGAISRMKGGGHGQSNIEFLEKNNVDYNITQVYENGVRVGNVPGHKVKAKRTGSNQSWFPENWTESDITAAGAKVAESPKFANAENGVAIFGEYKGVRVGVIKTNGEIGTIFPDATKQP